MANIYDISPLSYQPSTNMDWFTKAIFGGSLIERGKITPITGVKESTLLNLLELDGSVLQADNKDCAWTPEQLIKLSEKELKVKTYKINLEQCIDDLEKKRTIWMLKPGAKNTELPDTLEEATLDILAKELSSEIETMIFTGDSSKDSDQFDGAIKTLKESDDSIKVQGVTLTKANIFDEMEKLFMAIPEDVARKGLENGTLTIFVSSGAFTLVKLALPALFNSNVVIAANWSIDGDTIRYMGVEIVPVKGLDNSTMIAIDIDNFILGTDLMSDLEDIRLGQFPAPHDSKVFIDGRLRLGFVIPFESEAVIYSPDVESAPEEEPENAQGASFQLDTTPENNAIVNSNPEAGSNRNEETQNVQEESAPLDNPPINDFSINGVSLYDSNYADAINYINSSDSIEEIQTILEAEQAGKKRTTVMNAASKRMDELTKND